MTALDARCPCRGRLTREILSFVVLLGMAGLNGCGRQRIEGTVVLDGQPLAQGYINFRPMAGAKGQPVGAPIENGRYALSGPDGDLDGHFRVEIRALGTTGNTVRDDQGQVHDIEGQVLPARYNTQSTLQVEIKPRQPNEFPFSLESK